MAIKFEKIQAGMTLYSKSRGKMGNTTIRIDRVHPVHVVSVDIEKQSVLASWNGNPARTYPRRHAEKWYAKEPKVKGSAFDR